jgi:hypothetical protein
MTHQKIGIHPEMINAEACSQTVNEARAISDQILSYGSPMAISELMIEIMSIVSFELAEKQSQLEYVHKDVTDQIDAACSLRLMASKWLEAQNVPSSHP